MNSIDLNHGPIAWRRHLHTIPEIGFREMKTSAFIVEKLTSMGIEVHSNVGGTGVVGIIRHGSEGHSIALRADMDALKIQEHTNLPYASTHQGMMHACGHDGHSAMLLGAAEQLMKDHSLAGTIVLIFQPDEEHGGGARAMLADGLLERFPFEEIYALHNAPGLGIGEFSTCSGPVAGNEGNFELTLTGQGGHSSSPQKSNDPIMAAGQLITALQAIVSRRMSALENVVVSLTDISTDGTRNVLPQQVVLRGDCRSYSEEMQDLVENQLHTIGRGIAAAFGLEFGMTYSRDFASVVNNPQSTDFARNVARRVFGENKVHEATPTMGSEDFGLFLRHRPGNFALLGNGTEGRHGMPLHSAQYDFNDDAIQHGIAYWTALVHARLGN